MAAADQQTKEWLYSNKVILAYFLNYCHHHNHHNRSFRLMAWTPTSSLFTSYHHKHHIDNGLSSLWNCISWWWFLRWEFHKWWWTETQDNWPLLMLTLTGRRSSKIKKKQTKTKLDDLVKKKQKLQKDKIAFFWRLQCIGNVKDVDARSAWTQTGLNPTNT